MAAYTEKKKVSNKKWDAENLDRLSIALPKGMKEQIKEHASLMGDGSINGFIKRAITETIERDNSQEVAE